jgi:hypothetical protein
MTFQTSTLNQLEQTPDEMADLIAVAPCQEDALADVLFEQLDYLIQFADQERERMERVKTILMEPFN